MNNQLIYIAVHSDGQVLTVNTTRELCEYYVMDYFGINPNRQYTESAIFEGYHKINYSEFEDELDGYWIFKCGEDIHRINLFNMAMDKPV